jgi:hypothetical protein
MPGYLLDVGATIQCPHGGSASTTSTNQRVKAGGQAVAIVNDTTTVSGCSFQIPVGAGTKPQPCMKVQWLVPATRVKIGGQPALLKDSQGLCQSAEQIPQGPPNVVVTQLRVKGQ